MEYDHDIVGDLMGIDRHELEHRNWRSAATKPLERASGIDPLDVTIVPDDVETLAPQRQRKPQKSASKAKPGA